MKSVNCERFKIGTIIGSWEVIEEPFFKLRKKGKYDIKIYHVKCRCLKCNNTYDLLCDNLFTGKSKKCVYCSMRDDGVGESNGNWKGFGKIPASTFNAAKRGAKDRNIGFDITIEYLNELFLKQSKKCALTGMDISFKNRAKNKQTASLDRIDSSKDYVAGNVQWVHKDVNRMKNAFNQEYFVEICKMIANKNSSKE